MQNVLKAGVAASALTVLGSVGAQAGGFTPAGPSFTNPTFSSTVDHQHLHVQRADHGLDRRVRAGSATGITAAVPSALWDNGVAPNGETNVAFLQTRTSALQQQVGNFILGDQYVIKVVADARAATGPAGLSIGVNGTEYGGPVLSPTPVGAVDAYGTYATPWATYTSAVFTATSVSNRSQLQNLGIPGSSASTM